MISYGRQSISEDDIEAVLRSLRSDFLTCGPEVEAFEKEFAAFVGAKHAVAVCNATAALHLAMQVLGIAKGDRVVTSPNTFVASANAAAYVGATPDFSDIDLRKPTISILWCWSKIGSQIPRPLSRWTMPANPAICLKLHGLLAVVGLMSSRTPVTALAVALKLMGENGNLARIHGQTLQPSLSIR